MLLLLASLIAQEWPWYAGDAGGTKYSAMKDINRDNVAACVRPGSSTLPT